MDCKEAIAELVLHQAIIQESAVVRTNLPATWLVEEDNALVFKPYSSKAIPKLDRLMNINHLLLALSHAIASLDVNGNTIFTKNNRIVINKANFEELLKKVQDCYDCNDYACLLAKIVKILVDKGFLVPYISEEEPNTETKVVNINDLSNALNNSKEITISELAMKGILEGLGFRKDYEEIERRVKDELGIERGHVYFKTIHYDLLLKLSGARAKPEEFPSTLDIFPLPVVVEPPSASQLFTFNKLLESFGFKHPKVKSIEELREPLRKFLAEDNERGEKLAEVMIEVLKDLGFHYLTEYQYKYIINLLQSPNSLAIISSPTGSGKTLIFMIYVLANAIKAKIEGSNFQAYLIYPRKSLARDQLRKISELIFNFNIKAKDIIDSIRVGIRDGDTPQCGRESEERTFDEPLRNLKVKISGRECEIYHKYDGEEYKVYLKGCETPWEREWIFDFRCGSRDAFTETDIVMTNNSMLYKKTFDVWPSGAQFAEREKMIIVIDEAHEYIKYSNDLNALNVALLNLYYYSSLRGSNPFEKMSFVISSATIEEKKLIDTNEPTHTIQAVVVKGGKKEFPKDFVYSIIGADALEAYKDSVIYEDYSSVMSLEQPLSGPKKIRVNAVVNLNGRTFDKVLNVIADLAHTSLSFRSRGSPSFILTFWDSKNMIKDFVTKFYKEPTKTLETFYARVSEVEDVSAAYSSPDFYTWRWYLPLGNFRLEKTKEIVYKKLEEVEEFAKKGGTVEQYVNEGGLAPVLPHHADLDREIRAALEERVQRDPPLVLLSTSTLEVGVDFDNVFAVMQIGTVVSSASVIQRFGRSGRSKLTSHVAYGLLVLTDSNDSYYAYEKNAIEYLINLKMPFKVETPLVNVKNLVKHYTKLSLQSLKEREVPKIDEISMCKAKIEETLRFLVRREGEEVEDRIKRIMEIAERFVGKEGYAKEAERVYDEWLNDVIRLSIITNKFLNAFPSEATWWIPYPKEINKWIRKLERGITEEIERKASNVCKWIERIEEVFREFGCEKVREILNGLKGECEKEFEKLTEKLRAVNKLIDDILYFAKSEDGRITNRFEVDFKVLANLKSFEEAKEMLIKMIERYSKDSIINLIEETDERCLDEVDVDEVIENRLCDLEVAKQPLKALNKMIELEEIVSGFALLEVMFAIAKVEPGLVEPRSRRCNNVLPPKCAIEMYIGSLIEPGITDNIGNPVKVSLISMTEIIDDKTLKEIFVIPSSDYDFRKASSPFSHR